MPRVAYKRKRSASGKTSRKKYARPTRTIRGRGAYYVTGGGSASGNLGPFKVSAHTNAGYSQGGDKVLGYIAPKVTGTGAYSISAVRQNTMIRPALPTFANATYAEGGTIVRHREYLGPVVSDATAYKFKERHYSLNPAQQFSFPWLSQIAASYEEYKPNGLVFEFRSTCSDAIASSDNLALGQVMMCTQYDPTDNPFSGEVEMLNYFWSQNGKVSDNIFHFIECDPAQSPLSHYYTREGAPSSATDLRFSDFGRFTIATSGLQGTSVVVGQLWVSYEFIFYKPKMGAYSSNPSGSFHYSCGVAVGAGTPFGTLGSGQYYPENNMDVELKPGSWPAAQMWFPQTNVNTTYMIVLKYSGADAIASCAPPTITESDGEMSFVKYDSDLDYLACPAPHATQSICSKTVFLSINGDGLQHFVTVACTTIPADSNVDLYVVQMPWLNPQLYPTS